MLAPILGAAISCLLGMYTIEILQRQARVNSDSALCFVLSSFFGVALVILSSLQDPFPTLYKELQGYLFGQAATQTNVHVKLYTIEALIVVFLVILFYRMIKSAIFDREYARSIGFNLNQVEFVLLSIIVISVVIGIRTLGVVLMSAMLIFPAVSARLWTDRLEIMLLLGALFGMVSGFFGVVLSHEMSLYFTVGRQIVSFPTGPMIVVVAASLFLISALLSPQKGLLFRGYRILTFKSRCQQENLLKAIWKQSSSKNISVFSRAEMQNFFQANRWSLTLLLRALICRGYLRQEARDSFSLTSSGMLWGRKIVRLHRLWEVYLVQYCGARVDRVHPVAEEMEHIITPEIEGALVTLLNYPHVDPHKQPIPASEEKLLP